MRLYYGCNSICVCVSFKLNIQKFLLLLQYSFPLLNLLGYDLYFDLPVTSKRLILPSISAVFLSFVERLRHTVMELRPIGVQSARPSG